jgi:sortase A
VSNSCVLFGVKADAGNTVMQWLRKLERLLLIVGGVLVALYVAANVYRTVLSSAEMRRFESRQLASALGARETALTSNNLDFSLWSEHRIRDYEESLAGHLAPAIAILRIPKIHVEVPVLEGTDSLSLNRGVGHVTGTANPDENGNMAIAGHRDGFFRGLKDVALGDEIELATTGRTGTYIIDRISVVYPSDVSVLRTRPHASLTLITCYPFYFIGSAPTRYIVQASLAGSAPTDHALPVLRSVDQKDFTSTQMED